MVIQKLKSNLEKENVFVTIFVCCWKDPDPFVVLLDSDPGGSPIHQIIYYGVSYWLKILLEIMNVID